MHAWIKTHAGLSIGIVLILLLVCSGTVFVWSNYPRTHRALWERNKPEKYYIKIRYEHNFLRCLWVSESIWQDNRLVDMLSVEASGEERCTEIRLHTEDWSMDYIFEEIVGNCGKGTVACTVQYDPRFHYPARVASLYHYSFEVQDFTACDINKPNCP